MGYTCFIWVQHWMKWRSICPLLEPHDLSMSSHSVIPRGKKNLCHSSPSLHKLSYNKEISAKLNLIFYSISLRFIHIRPYHGLGIHWRLLIAKVVFSPMAIHVGFRVQMTAMKRALEYWVSRRKGLMNFILHTILYITKLSVAPIIRAIASNYFITATNSLERIWTTEVIAWLKVLFQRLPAKAETKHKSL